MKIRKLKQLKTIWKNMSFKDFLVYILVARFMVLVLQVVLIYSRGIQIF